MIDRKILFIVVPNYKILDKVNVVNYRPPFLIPPYGVLSISSYIRKYSMNRLNIRILDLNTIVYNNSIGTDRNTKSHSEILQEIDLRISECVSEFNPDIIGCSLLFNSGFEYVQTITDTLANVKGKSLVIFGGKVASNHYRDFIEEFPSIDVVCLGEGEVPFLQLADASNMIDEIHQNMSMITRKSLGAGVIPKTQYVIDLDEIPPFAFDLIDMEKYLTKYVSSLRSVEVKANEVIKGLEVISTRGCPFDCIFCTSHAVHGKKIRYRSADSIISEIVFLKEKYELSMISFQDDNFFHNKKRAIDILDKLIELDLDIHYEFANGIAIYCVDDEIASRLEKLRLPDITVSVESGSPFMLNQVIKKPLKVEMVKPAVEILRNHNIRVFASFVFGIPSEKEEDRQLSLELIKNVGFDWVHLFAAIPFSGSRLYDICIKNNYISGKSTTISATTKYSNGIINTEDFTAEYINKFVYTNNLQFNFLNNYNFEKGNYDIAIMYFKKVLQDFEDHALAHYMIYKSYKELKEVERSEEYKASYIKIIENNEFWNGYAKQFNLSVDII